MDDDLSIAQDFKSMITSTAKSAAEEKTTAVRQAIATSDSANGKVKVKLSGITISGDDSQDIEVKDGTGTGVFKGDTVSVMLSGTDPTALYVIARGKQMSNLLDQTSNVANDAKSTADTASTTAEDAWARTLRVQVSSSPADATGDTSRLTATVWRGGEQLSDETVAKMGLLAWYVGGKRVATGSTYTCAAGTATESRLEA
jgi:hypothetical protein